MVDCVVLVVRRPPLAPAFCYCAAAGLSHLKLAGVHAIIALDEGITQVVDAELVESLQSTKVKVQVVGVPVISPTCISVAQT